MQTGVFSVPMHIPTQGPDVATQGIVRIVATSPGQLYLGGATSNCQLYL